MPITNTVIQTTVCYVDACRCSRLWLQYAGMAISQCQDFF